MTFDSAFQSALRTQGAILSDDEIKRAEFVARSVTVAMLREARLICRDLAPERNAGPWCAGAMSGLIRQVQETSPAVTCAYCSSKSAAIRETYFDQCCAGCIRRMCDLR